MILTKRGAQRFCRIVGVMALFAKKNPRFFSILFYIIRLPDATRQRLRNWELALWSILAVESAFAVYLQTVRSVCTSRLYKKGIRVRILVRDCS